MVKKGETLSLDRLEALKKEIDSLKSKKLPQKVESKKATPANVMHTMEELSGTLGQFMEAFQEATEEMRLEEKEEEFFARELKPLHDKLDLVLEQNEKIAKGIIAVANMLNTDIPFIKRMVAGAGPSVPPMNTAFETPKPSFSTMPPPVAPRAKPRARSPGQLTGAPMPPPPKPATKKKGRFADLFK